MWQADAGTLSHVASFFFSPVAGASMDKPTSLADLKTTQATGTRAFAKLATTQSGMPNEFHLQLQASGGGYDNKAIRICGGAGCSGGVVLAERG